MQYLGQTGRPIKTVLHERFCNSLIKLARFFIAILNIPVILKGQILMYSRFFNVRKVKLDLMVNENRNIKRKICAEKRIKTSLKVNP